MSCGKSTNIQLEAGETYAQTFRWGQLPIVYKPVTAAPDLAPLTLTVTAHGAPDGWAVALNDFASPLDALNAANDEWPPQSDGWHAATAVDANTLAINDIDAELLGAYTSGGTVAYYSPVDLTGYTGVFNIYPSPPQATPPVPIATGTVTIDNTAKTIQVTIAATTSGALNGNYTWALVMTAPSGAVIFLATGKMLVTVPGSA